MSKVTDELLNLLKKQIQDHGIVVWYDPEGHYTNLIGNLKLPDTKIIKYQGSFFKLRYDIEPYLEFVDENGNICANPEVPPKILVYVPLSRRDTDYALIEVESYGTVMEPGASHWQRNTRLKVVAERVFKKIRPDQVSDISKKVEKNIYTFEDLDRLSEQDGDLGNLKLIFQTSVPEEILLKFLCLKKFDRKITDKHALPELGNLIETVTGFHFDSNQSLLKFKEELARYLLLAEFVLKIKDLQSVPETLDFIPIPASSAQQKFILEFCAMWRNRYDLQNSYMQYANKIEKNLSLASLNLSDELLLDIETFAGIEEILFSYAKNQILTDNSSKVISIAEKRKQLFWSRCKEEYNFYWRLIKIAAQLIESCKLMQSELKNIQKRPDDLFRAYIYGRDISEKEFFPWYRVDQLKRHLETYYAKFDLELDSSDLEEIMLIARRKYYDAAASCAEQMSKAIEEKGLNVSKFLRQSEIFQKKLQPLLSEGKVAYILVDALRYEMGQEFIKGLEDEFEIKIEPAIAQPPTITEIGMAALMPGAERGMRLVNPGPGKIGISIGDHLLKDRASRIKYFHSFFQEKVAVLKLRELFKKRKLDEIKDADIILITSQQIDRRGEQIEDSGDARIFMEDVLGKLRRGIRKLFYSGVNHIVVVADHGFVFIDAIDESMKIEPPGGNTINLHPRAWIGSGGNVSPFYIRLKAHQIGIQSEFEFAFPRGLACFKTRGELNEYFHGGLSLPELVIPIILISSKQKQNNLSVKDIPCEITIKFNRKKITNRLFTIEILFNIKGLLRQVVKEGTKKVKVEVRSDKLNAGDVISAAYGFDEISREILLKNACPNNVTIMLKENIPNTISIYVLDVESEIVLASLLNIPVELII